MTPGSVDEGHLLGQMIEAHERNIQKSLDTVVADSLYGKIENFLICQDFGLKPHIPSLEESQKGSGRKKGIFPKEAFTYDPNTDTFTCPAGQSLRKRNYYKSRKHYEYKASRGTCARCELKDQCTKAKDGRSLKRHVRQDDLDTMLKCASTREAKRDLKHRQHLSERSFAQSERYGYKRARWRRLWRVEIQDFLIAAIHNILILIKHSEHNAQSQANAKVEQIGLTHTNYKLLGWPLYRSKGIWTVLSQGVRSLVITTCKRLELKPI